LWQHAERHTPKKRCNHYTQAMMDLGATVCTRTKPMCSGCPVADTCLAFAQKNVALYPGKKPKKILPVKSVQLLMLRNPVGDILLQQRPSQGIWGGLWSFPEIAIDQDPCSHTEDYFSQVVAHEIWDAYRHTFSHYHLDITPVLLQLKKEPTTIAQAPETVWYNLHQPSSIGLAAPVKKLLEKLAAMDPRK
jgi:A/G-specific adenine glycosylase